MDQERSLDGGSAVVGANREEVGHGKVNSPEESDVEPIVESEYDKVVKEYGIPKKGILRIQQPSGGPVVHRRCTGLPKHRILFYKYVRYASIGIRIFWIVTYLILDRIPARYDVSSINPEQFKDLRKPLRAPMFLEVGGDVLGPILENMFYPWAFMLYSFFMIYLKYVRTRKSYDFRQAWMVPSLIFPLTGTLVALLKILMSSPRPTMFARCYGEDYLIYNDFSAPCTGNATLISDGMKSFPCLYTSVAFSSSTFMFLYIAAYLRLWSEVVGRKKAWRGFPFRLTFFTVTPAIIVGVSRVVGNNQHVEDVIGGALIGALVACKVYFYHYPSVLRYDCYLPRTAGEADLYDVKALDAAVRFDENPDPDKDPIWLPHRTQAEIDLEKLRDKNEAIIRRSVVAAAIRPGTGRPNPTFRDPDELKK